MKSSNASASAFGWDFQSNAAIMLMLKNIEKASKVKVEGATEDVEITFNDGSMLMSQAKAVMDTDNYRNVKKKLEEALRTLNTAAKISNVEQLVFVTNSPNPFNDSKTMYKFSSPLNTIPFSELPIKCRQVISTICASRGYDFDTSSLTVCVMQFSGENEDERYKVLSALTTEFLNHLGVHKIATNELLSLWQRTFTINSSQLTTSITKKRMVWPIIAILCNVSEDDADMVCFDECDVTEILQRYRSVINNNAESFEFISRVLGDYNDFHPEMNSQTRVQKFIAEKWMDYKGTIDLQNADQTIEETVVKLTVRNVLRSRTVIAEIKGKVKL